MSDEYKQRPNSGSMFINRDKQEDKHPDFTGRLLIGPDLLELVQAGEELQISGWKKQTKGGQTFLSLSVKKVFRKGQGTAPPRRSASPSLDDPEAPF